MNSIVIQKGDRGPHVEKLQRAMNKRAPSRGIEQVVVDGIMGPVSWRVWEQLYGALGGKPGTFAGGTTRALRRYRFVRFPGTRGSLARRRAKAWRKPTTTGPAAAIAFFRKYNGKKESPAGSNLGGWGLTAWQRSFGAWLVGAAWCGTMLGKALQAAGVKGINSRVASVRFILEDALNGRNGFEKCVYRRATGHGSLSAIRPGDLVGLYGEGTHVEIVEKVVAGGFRCRGGNTSAGPGSVSNGGMVAANFRPASAVVYAVRPRYPKG
jgi:hypothetical protein